MIFFTDYYIEEGYILILAADQVKEAYASECARLERGNYITTVFWETYNGNFFNSAIKDINNNSEPIDISHYIDEGETEKDAFGVR